MQKTWIHFLDWEDTLGKEMATHCNILAWRIPWTEEPGRLQSMRSQESDVTKPPPLTTGVDSLDLIDINHRLRSVPTTWQRGTWEKMVHSVYDETVLVWPRKFWRMKIPWWVLNC